MTITPSSSSSQEESGDDKSDIEVGKLIKGWEESNVQIMSHW